MKTGLNTAADRRPCMGWGVFARAAVTLLSRGRPCPIAHKFGLFHAKRDASRVLGYEDQAQPGEGGVDA